MGMTLGLIGHGEVGGIFGRALRQLAGVDAVLAWDLRFADAQRRAAAEADGITAMDGMAALCARATPAACRAAAACVYAAAHLDGRGHAVAVAHGGRVRLRAFRGARTLGARALRQTLRGNGHPARSIHIGTL
jgi:hypothetical protein